MHNTLPLRISPSACLKPEPSEAWQRALWLKGLVKDSGRSARAPAALVGGEVEGRRPLLQSWTSSNDRKEGKGKLIGKVQVGGGGAGRELAS